MWALRFQDKTENLRNPYKIDTQRDIETVTEEEGKGDLERLRETHRDGETPERQRFRCPERKTK